MSKDAQTAPSMSVASGYLFMVRGEASRGRVVVAGVEAEGGGSVGKQENGRCGTDGVGTRRPEPHPESTGMAMIARAPIPDQDGLGRGGSGSWATILVCGRSFLNASARGRGSTTHGQVNGGSEHER